MLVNANIFYLLFVLNEETSLYITVKQYLNQELQYYIVCL